MAALLKEAVSAYGIYQWLLLFFTYSFFGWIYESLYVSCCKKKWVNRGFMVGPMLPLYGSGAIVMLFVSMPFQDNLIWVYCSGCVGATLLEYVTGVFMEKLFKIRYWDYSNKRFQFQGHICLEATLLWGVFTVAMVKVLNPPIAGMIVSLDEKVVQGIVFVVSLAAIADFTYSFKAALDLRRVLVHLEEARREVENLRKRLDVLIAFSNDSRAEKREQFAEQIEQMRKDHEEKARQNKERISMYMETRLEAMRLQLEELKKNEYRKGLARNEESRKYWDELDDIKEKLAVFRERNKQAYKNYSFGMRNLLKGNPDAVSREDASLLEELRSMLEKGRKK